MSGYLRMVGMLTALSSICALGEVPENRLQELYPYQGPVLPDSRHLDRSKITVAIYKDVGVWSTGYEHLKLFFASRAYSWRSVSAAQIKSGILSNETLDFLVMPGGASWEYLKSLGSSGATNIKRFVLAGGGYIGICAGAFYAVSHREGGYATGPYGIGLLEGVAHDGTALGTEGFFDGMIDYDINARSIPSQLQMILLGGPSFRYSDAEALNRDLKIIGRFASTNDPTMIQFNYGYGRVFLRGPHLEVEENLVQWEYRNPIGHCSKWPLAHCNPKISLLI